MMKHVSEYADEVVNELLARLAEQDRNERIDNYARQLDDEERDASWLADPRNFGSDYE